MIRGPRNQFADEGLAITFTFFRITRKIFQFGTCQFKTIVRYENSIFRENFSSWRFDSGKIFKIILFSRGPRTPYCSRFVSIGHSNVRGLLRDLSEVKILIEHTNLDILTLSETHLILTRNVLDDEGHINGY